MKIQGSTDCFSSPTQMGQVGSKQALSADQIEYLTILANERSKFENWVIVEQYSKWEKIKMKY